jgi:hypothetical protein
MVVGPKCSHAKELGKYDGGSMDRLAFSDWLFGFLFFVVARSSTANPNIFQTRSNEAVL